MRSFSVGRSSLSANALAISFRQSSFDQLAFLWPAVGLDAPAAQPPDLLVAGAEAARANARPAGSAALAEWGVVGPRAVRPGDLIAAPRAQALRAGSAALAEWDAVGPQAVRPGDLVAARR